MKRLAQFKVDWDFLAHRVFGSECCKSHKSPQHSGNVWQQIHAAWLLPLTPASTCLIHGAIQVSGSDP